MERAILLVLIFVCHSRQMPQLELDDLTTTTEDMVDTTTEEITTSSEKPVQVNETTTPAVTVQSSINVTKSNLPPRQIFEDFKPSKYYRPDDYPVFERPSPQITGDVFYKPQYFGRPVSSYIVRPMPPPVPNEKNIAFPQATQEYYNYSEHLQHNTNNHSTNSHNNNVQNNNNVHNNNNNVQNNNKNNNSNYKNINSNNENWWLNSPDSKGPYRFTEVLPQYKPMKHDYGEVIPNFSTYDSAFYEKHFAKAYYGNEMAHYPDIIHEPPKSYSGIAPSKKKDPWKTMLSVLATILPVGLLLASFPPTVIKVNSTQYPYQFQKNSTAYNPHVYPGGYNGAFKALRRRKNTGRKMNEENDPPEFVDGCLKKKICEKIKANHSPSELDTLLRNTKLNSTDTDISSNNYYRSPYMMEIAEAAASTLPESCQVFVCSSSSNT